MFLTAKDMSICRNAQLTLAYALVLGAYLTQATSGIALGSTYNSLCSTGSRFEKCDLVIKGGVLESISMDGLASIKLCSKLIRLSYRSNPASPYVKFSLSKSDLSKKVKAEAGIDHDFLLTNKEIRGSKAWRLIIRFKNKDAALKFATAIEESIDNQSCPS